MLCGISPHISVERVGGRSGGCSFLPSIQPVRMLGYEKKSRGVAKQGLGGRESKRSLRKEGGGQKRGGWSSADIW